MEAESRVNYEELRDISRVRNEEMRDISRVSPTEMSDIDDSNKVEVQRTSDDTAEVRVLPRFVAPRASSDRRTSKQGQCYYSICGFSYQYSESHIIYNTAKVHVEDIVRLRIYKYLLTYFRVIMQIDFRS